MPHKRLLRNFKAGIAEIQEGLPLARRGVRSSKAFRAVRGALRGGLTEARGGELNANRRVRLRKEALKRAAERRKRRNK